MPKLEDLKAKLLPLIRGRAMMRLAKPIRLASGKMSNVYFDGRKVTLDPEGISLLARAILELVDVSQLDAVGGPTIGADPIATAVSIFAYLEKGKKLPVFLVRKEVKQHGLQKQIEGVELKKGMMVLIVEDVVTTGQSVRGAIAAVEASGAKVSQIVCLLDRNEGDGRSLESYPFVSIFSRSEVEA